MCKESAIFKSTSELKNHRKEYHGCSNPWFCYEEAAAKRPIVCIDKTGQTTYKQAKVESVQWNPTATVSKISAIDMRKLIFIRFSVLNFYLIFNLLYEKKTAFKCGICLESVLFETATELKRHMRDKHNWEYECYICKIKLNGWNDVKQHIRRHVQARNEKCDICAEMYTAKELNRHLCADGKSIQCEYCTKSFGATAKLIRHVEIEHATEKILHRCKKCHRFFGMALLKDLHEMQHDNEEKLHVCEICSKAFSRRNLYEYHLVRHSNESMH